MQFIVYGKKIIPTFIDETLAKIAKSAIVRASPANHFDFSKNDSKVFNNRVTAARRSGAIFLTPARRTGR